MMGLYINGKWDVRFGGKCAVCGSLTRDSLVTTRSRDHWHVGEAASIYRSDGSVKSLGPEIQPGFPPNLFACPFCDGGKVDFVTGMHSGPVCKKYKGLEPALAAWDRKLGSGRAKV